MSKTFSSRTKVSPALAAGFFVLSGWMIPGRAQDVASNETTAASGYDIPVISTGPADAPEKRRSLSVKGVLKAGADRVGVPAEGDDAVRREVRAAAVESKGGERNAAVEPEAAAVPDEHDIPILGPAAVQAERGIRPRLNLASGVKTEPDVKPMGSAALEKLGPPDLVDLLDSGAAEPVSDSMSAAGVPARRSLGRRSGGDLAWSEEDAAEEEVYPEGAPISEGEVSSWQGGYFPTQDDSIYIGDRDYARSSRGFGTTHPDLHSQNFTGIFPYESPHPTFFDQYDYIFDPLDRTLGFFAPHQALVWEAQNYHELSFIADGGLNLFTRGYDPNRAHVKMGPLYLDLLSIGAGILYSDYNGPQTFAEGQEDGWLSFVDLHIRAVMQLSETFYLIVSGSLIYLPGENDFGFRVGDGAGPHAIARLNYQTRVGEWDIQLYDEFLALIAGDLFWDAADPAYDQAGRYSFGFLDRSDRSYSLFEDGSVAFANTIGARASRPLGSEWRLWLEGDHSDYWRTYDFTDHTYRDHFGALLGYEGTRIPFSPYLEYDTYSTDSFETSAHTAYVGARGRLSENLRLNARGGRFWTAGMDPDRESWVWDATLTHDVNERTRQSVSVGQTYALDPFSDQSALSEFVSYNVGYRLTDWIYASGFAQWSEDEYITGRSGGWKRQLYGGNLNMRPLDYTQIGVGAAYERSEQVPDGDDYESRLYYASLTQRLYSRTTVWFRYQFEEAETFDEHLYTAGVRRYF